MHQCSKTYHCVYLVNYFVIKWTLFTLFVCMFNTADVQKNVYCIKVLLLCIYIFGQQLSFMWCFSRPPQSYASHNLISSGALKPSPNIIFHLHVFHFAICHIMKKNHFMSNAVMSVAKMPGAFVWFGLCKMKHLVLRLNVKLQSRLKWGDMSQAEICWDPVGGGPLPVEMNHLYKNKTGAQVYVMFVFVCV